MSSSTVLPVGESLAVPAPERHGAVRILMADDHGIFRQSLCMLLQQQGFEVVGEASGGRKAVELAESLRPDVVILDYNMPGMNGIDTARALQRSVPEAQTILLTTQEDNASAVEALRAGMHGYVYKSQTAEELVHTVREVAKGAIHFSTRLPPMAIESYFSRLAREPASSLTEREQQVLSMIAVGQTTRAIAESLGLSIKTVESHRSRIMRKLHMHRAAELIRYAIRHQIITA